MKAKRGFLTFSILLVLLFSGPLSWAHRVNVFVWKEGNRVFAEGFFSDGKKAAHSRIEVFGADGKSVLAGETDDKGLFSFQLPQKTDLKIVLHASGGHRAEFRLAASDIGSVKGSGDNGGVGKDATTAAVPCMGKEEIESLIVGILDEKLRPMQRKLAESEHRGVSLTDILGGIGYIFGLVGVAIYFSHRKKRHTGHE